MAASLDTNCLLRWLLDDVPSQTEQVIALLDSRRIFVIEDAVFIETVFVLEKVKKISRPTVQQAVLSIIGRSNIKCSRELFTETMEIYVNHSKLSMVDCYLSVKARQSANIPLFTFDEKLAKQVAQVELVP
jgi:predicted nucleic-acid-binding protein